MESELNKEKQEDQIINTSLLLDLYCSTIINVIIIIIIIIINDGGMCGDWGASSSSIIFQFLTNHLQRYRLSALNLPSVEHIFT